MFRALRREWVYRCAPRLWEKGYRFVADRRPLFTRIDRFLWGPREEPPSHLRVRSVFLRLMGVIYLIAFVSLWSQQDGLTQITGTRGAEAVCAAGTAAALLLIVGVLPAPCLAALWGLYLWLFRSMAPFLNYQWDILLLEAGFLAFFWAPWRLQLGWSRGPRPSTAVLWLLRWLAARLMLSSAVAKLVSGDPTWSGLTALQYHYETQPLPTWIGWHAHQLPAWFHTVSALGMFGVELGLPLLALMPRRPRLLAFWGFVALQVAIGLTGNYGFFNLLTLVLCVPLLEDRSAGVELPRRGLVWPVMAFVLILTIFRTIETFKPSLNLPSVPGVTGRYGLFAVMTTTRYEIEIEGSRDGVEWRAYKFRYKPPAHPAILIGHMPRLDWQMWFLPLRPSQRPDWFLALCQALLEGRPAVRGLLADDPFGDAPPKFIRATAYEMHFARDHRQGWWSRQWRGVYCPPLWLKR